MSMIMDPFGAIVAYLEDDCLINDTMVDVFEALGCRVLAATDGANMMALLAAGTLVPDIVVSDFFMPGDNGAVMIARIRHEIGREVPAILLSGYTLTEELQAQIPPNVVLLRKPVQVPMLRATLAALGIVTKVW